MRSSTFFPLLLSSLCCSMFFPFLLSSLCFSSLIPGSKSESPANIYRYLLEGEDGLSDDFVNNLNQRCEKDEQGEQCPILLQELRSQAKIFAKCDVSVFAFESKMKEYLDFCGKEFKIFIRPIDEAERRWRVCIHEKVIGWIDGSLTSLTLELLHQCPGTTRTCLTIFKNKVGGVARTMYLQNEITCGDLHGELSEAINDCAQDTARLTLAAGNRPPLYTFKNCLDGKVRRWTAKVEKEAPRRTSIPS